MGTLSVVPSRRFEAVERGQLEAIGLCRVSRRGIAVQAIRSSEWGRLDSWFAVLNRRPL